MTGTFADNISLGVTVTVKHQRGPMLTQGDSVFLGLVGSHLTPTHPTLADTHPRTDREGAPASPKFPRSTCVSDCGAALTDSHATAHPHRWCLATPARIEAAARRAHAHNFAAGGTSLAPCVLNSAQN